MEIKETEGKRELVWVEGGGLELACLAWLARLVW